MIDVGVIVAGSAVAAVSFVKSRGSQGWGVAFQQLQANFGRAILLGLEFLAAADIIGTVAITPDAQAYCYSYLRRLGDLYIVEGLR